MFCAILHGGDEKVVCFFERDDVSVSYPAFEHRVFNQSPCLPEISRKSPVFLVPETVFAPHNLG